MAGWNRAGTWQVSTGKPFSRAARTRSSQNCLLNHWNPKRQRPPGAFLSLGIEGMPNPCQISRHMQRQVYQGQYSLWLIPCTKRETSAARLATHQPDRQAWGRQHQSSASDHMARPANLAFGCRDSMIVIPALSLLLSASLYQESH